MGIGLEEVFDEEVALSGELKLPRNSPSELSELSDPRPLLLLKDNFVSIGLDDVPLFEPGRGPPFNRCRSSARTGTYK